MDAVLVYADPFAVQGGIVLRCDVPIAGDDENAVFLRSHRELRVKYLFRALLGIGNVAHHVDLAVEQFLHQFRPAALDVGKVPAGIRRELLLVLIGIAGAASRFVHDVERGFVPSDAHVFPCAMRRHRQRKRGGRKKQKQERGKPPQAIKNRFAWGIVSRGVISFASCQILYLFNSSIAKLIADFQQKREKNRRHKRR